MLEHVDFVEQAVVAGVDQGGRPDVIVRLPNGRAIVIDAKAPLDRFLLATEEDDPDRRQAHLDAHGKAVHDHATTLSRRRYDDVVDGAIDLVVMFIPGEAFLSTAFEARPTLLEDGLGQRIVVASPTSLMGLLRAVALGWREQRVAEQAEQITLLGHELHERVRDVRRAPRQGGWSTRPGGLVLQRCGGLLREPGTGFGPSLRGSRRGVDPGAY